MRAMIYLYESPLGTISYDWSDVICQGLWLHAQDTASETHDDPISRWLASYFNRSPAILPPLAEAATPFQQKMRDGLWMIPAGEVRTYGEIARTLQTSPRAIGQALGANPLPLLVPCHRIIAADGLGGFSSDLEWKKKLLRFERGF
ncbi:methylated-DNA--[protein]-cysteine S-methyltransferase [Mariprofundus erugo]|nr:methylated-DNA--[protein]-cysteine S-methyltransferase [Mariprofundus erugo]